MTLSDRALSFAIRAHEGQVRKSEPDKPYVIHPIIVGSILKKYGYDEQVVAAGYLHDIVEETEFTIDDIARLFGGSVASLVMTATEADASLSWKERKTQQLKVVATLPERNAAIICADKIANVEDLRMEKRKNGYIDYTNFHTDEEGQKWFFQEMHKTLSKIMNGPMVDRLANSVYDVFEAERLSYYSEQHIFGGISRIAGFQEDLMKLRTIVGDTKPYVIEFAGTPKSGKTSMIRLFRDFFENAEFRVRVCEERDAVSRYEQEFIRNKASISTVEKNLLISSAIREDLMQQIAGDQDIIMVENSLFDSLVLIKILLDRGQISMEDFELYVNYYKEQIESLINHVVISYTSPEVVRERIIANAISEADVAKAQELEAEYRPYVINEAIRNFESLVSSASVVDTTKFTVKESSLIVAEKLLPIMRKEYVLRLKDYLDKKKED